MPDESIKGSLEIGAEETPLISVLIPARNEELNIGECLDSIMVAIQALDDHEGDTPQIEVLVLDDRSTDATVAQVEARMALFERMGGETPEPGADAPPGHRARLRLIAGADLPSGWIGKSWACHQLARHARGGWLLYLDADARLEPQALVRLRATARRERRGMLTGFPRQVVRGWLERLVVPLMAFTIACHLPIKLVRTSRDPKFAAAHGAFIFIARETYDASGGHEQFRAHLVDDVMLARAVKRVSHPLALLDVTDLVRMRMYRNAGEVWRGYKKNIFPGIGRNQFIFALIILLYSFLFLFPAIVFVASLMDPTSSLLWWSGACYLLSVFLKMLIDHKNGVPIVAALLMPLSIACMLLIMVDSWRTALFGGTYEWKGRRYS